LAINRSGLAKHRHGPGWLSSMYRWLLWIGRRCLTDLPRHARIAKILLSTANVVWRRDLRAFAVHGMVSSRNGNLIVLGFVDGSNCLRLLRGHLLLGRRLMRRHSRARECLIRSHWLLREAWDPRWYWWSLEPCRQTSRKLSWCRSDRGELSTSELWWHVLLTGHLAKAGLELACRCA
jgi:hypothetical protein